jgi:putative transposase
MRYAPQELRTYFVTISTADRRRLFQVETNAALMIDTLAHYRGQLRFFLHAFVVMPDHIHVLITPAPDVSLEKAIQFIKGGFSYRLKSRMDVWGRGYFEKRVPDRAAFEACASYIHRNPVKAGMIEDEEAAG